MTCYKIHTLVLVFTFVFTFRWMWRIQRNWYRKLYQLHRENSWPICPTQSCKWWRSSFGAIFTPKWSQSHSKSQSQFISLFTFMIFVSFIPFSVFGFWSFTKILCNLWLHFARQDVQDRKKQKENHSTKVNKIPKHQKTKICDEQNINQSLQFKAKVNKDTNWDGL